MTIRCPSRTGSWSRFKSSQWCGILLGVGLALCPALILCSLFFTAGPVGRPAILVFLGVYIMVMVVVSASLCRRHPPERVYLVEEEVHDDHNDPTRGPRRSSVSVEGGQVEELGVRRPLGGSGEDDLVEVLSDPGYSRGNGEPRGAVHTTIQSNQVRVEDDTPPSYTDVNAKPPPYHVLDVSKLPPYGDVAGHIQKDIRTNITVPVHHHHHQQRSQESYDRSVPSLISPRGVAVTCSSARPLGVHVQRASARDVAS